MDTIDIKKIKPYVEKKKINVNFKAFIFNIVMLL